MTARIACIGTSEMSFTMSKARNVIKLILLSWRSVQWHVASVNVTTTASNTHVEGIKSRKRRPVWLTREEATEEWVYLPALSVASVTVTHAVVPLDSTKVI